MQKIRESFDPEERSCAMIRELNEISLYVVIEKITNNEKKDLLNMLFLSLSDIQNSLPEEYHYELILKNTLFNSVINWTDANFHIKNLQTAYRV